MLGRTLCLMALFLIFFTPIGAGAGTPVTDVITFQKARVTTAAEERAVLIPGTEAQARVQTLTAEIINGPERGRSVTFENDYAQLAVGDVFYLRHTVSALDEIEYWSVADPYRLPVLAVLALAFLTLLALFGGLQGVRGLAALAGSIVLIFVALIPAMLHGFSPALVASGVAGIIIVLGSYITHGFNRTTSAAVLGMLATVVITGAVGWWAVTAARLSGYSSEEASSLFFQTAGGIDIVGLLFGGIVIGLLGVLYDIAIGQAVAVEELYSARTGITSSEVLRRGLRIGREHIGALVNTLAIAYVGASLPLFLLVVSSSTASPAFILNNELFATEIIRILVGSMGLILAVPFTTWVAVRLLKPSLAE